MRGGGRSSDTPPMLPETTAHKLRYSSTAPSNGTRARKAVGTVSPGGDSVAIMEDDESTDNNPTSTTTMMAEYPTIERQYNKLSSLSTKLSKYTRGSDRRQVLRTLHDSTLYPKLHALRGVEGIEDIAAAEREVASERAVLNGVKFPRAPRDGAGSIASSARAATTMPVDSYFLQTVREVCGHVCDMDGVTADPMALYGGLLLRLCRSASECDALETLTRWTCCTSGELVLLPIVRRHHAHRLIRHAPAAAVANTTTTNDGTMTAAPPPPPPPLAEPLELELYVEGGNVHAKVSMKHEFGLYRRTDLEGNNNSIATAATTTTATTTHTGKNITTTTATTLVPWNQLIVLAQQEGLEALVRQQQQQQQQAQLHQAQQYNNQPKKKNKTRSNNNKAATTNSRNDSMSATHELSAIQYTILAQLLRQQQQQQIQGGQYHHHHHQTHKVGNIKPWVYINATVVERINFGTGSSVRVLHVAVPEDKNSGYVKK